MLTGHLGIEPVGPTAGLYHQMTSSYKGGIVSFMAGLFDPVFQSIDIAMGVSCPGCEVKAAISGHTMGDWFLRRLAAHHIATGSDSWFGAGFGAGSAIATLAGTGLGGGEAAAETAPEVGGARFSVDTSGVAADLGSRTAATRPVVMGEGMQARVIPAAQKLGADWYQPPPLNDVQSMAHNRVWINEMMNQGRGIVDIGAAPGRDNFPGPTSPWYAMERDQISQRSYPYYLQFPWGS